MKKKGFTVVELLAIIVVLGVIVVVVVPQIGGTVDSKKEGEYNKLIEMIETSAKVYHSYNPSANKINIQTLIDQEYLTNDIINPVTGEKITGCVNVTKDSDGINVFTYSPTC